MRLPGKRCSVSDQLLFLLVLLRMLTLTVSSLERNISRDQVLSPSKLAQRILVDYEKSEPPEGPTIVQLGIYINSFYAISEQTMDFSLNLYLRQQWRDNRLQYDKKDNNGQDKLKLGDGMWDRLWTPDVFFRNEKKAAFHVVTTPNRLLNLHSNGTVWYVSKITATLSCPMRLHKYPLDTQDCPMMFESFGYTMDHIIYKWLPNPVQHEKALELPQFRLINHTLNDCSQNYTTGAYPCLQIIFTLKRDIGYYMIQLYVPSVLIVILSWVAFWISIEAIPARVTIGLLTVLTMTTQSAGSRTALPRVSYIKAIDVWMSVCQIFVFASLLEFAVVNVYSRKEIKQRRRNGQLKRPFGREDIALEQLNAVVSHNGRDFSQLRGPSRRYPSSAERKLKARQIDKMSRKLFPLSFLSFNIIYWLSYILG